MTRWRAPTGGVGLARLEEAIALWLAGSAGIKSGLERAFLDLVVEAGLPKPIPNIHVAGAQVDGFWPDARLVVEIDGPNHTRPPSIVADDSRDLLLAEIGIDVLRFTEFEVERRPRRGRRGALAALEGVERRALGAVEGDQAGLDLLVVPARLLVVEAVVGERVDVLLALGDPQRRGQPGGLRRRRRP